MQSAQRDEEEPRNYPQRTTMQSAQRDEVGARPLAATRLGGPPPACGGEPRNYPQRTTLTPPSTGITAPVM